MTDKFSKPILRNLRTSLQDILKAECFGDKIPFEYTLGNCSFDEDQAKFQLIVTFKGNSVEDIAKKKQKEDLEHYAKYFDIDLERKHPRYTLVGYKIKSRNCLGLLQIIKRVASILYLMTKQKSCLVNKMLILFLKVKGRLKQMDKLRLSDLNQLREWVDQMYWDFDRLSSSGQETLDKIADKLGMETNADVESRINKNIKDLEERNPTWTREKVYSEALRLG